MPTEKRLIDANEFLTEVVKLQALSPEHAVAKIILLLSDMNGVDAVPVVRCRECKHWVYTDETWGDCTNPRFHIPGIVDPTMNCDEYCALGERRNNEN